MNPTLQELLSVRATGDPDRFIGRSEDYGPVRVYGGHFVGQALAAGFATVPEPMLAQSLHACFLRPGDVDAEIRYDVVALRDGRGSVVRNITAVQADQPVFSMLASFKRPESGDAHQPAMPTVPSPEQLQAAPIGPEWNPPPARGGRAELLMASAHFLQETWVPGREARLRVWMRCAEAAAADERMAQVMLGYLSDSTLMFNAGIPHGLPFRTHRVTSIDHAVWFHRPADPRQWLLFDQRSDAAADGRGLSRGALYTRGGELVLTAVQESLLRRMDPGAAAG